MINNCNDCGKKTKLEKHHVCYFPEMVVALCKTCHKKRHTTGNAPRKLPIGQINIMFDLTLEQDIWVTTQKKVLGLKRKEQVIQKLIEQEMLKGDLV